MRDIKKEEDPKDARGFLVRRPGVTVFLSGSVKHSASVAQLDRAFDSSSDLPL
jgi:hypothetical protein